MNYLRHCATQTLLLLLLVGCMQARSLAETINEAIHRGDIAAVRRMLRTNPSLVAFRGADSNAPLHWAAWDGRADIVKLLIDGGANVNDRRAMDGGTPLWLAGWRGFDDVAKLLLQNGADPELRSNDGNTPLHEAAAYGHVDLVERFLIIGQRVDTLNKEGDTPLGVAAVWGQPNVAKCLIGNGADIHHRNLKGQTIIDVALAHNHEEIASLIRNYQAALNERAVRDLARKSSPVAIRKGYQNWGGPNMLQKQVYNGEFAEPDPDPEWSTRPLTGTQQAPLHISVTPLRGHRFLGELGSQTARLTLTGLPDHTEASVAFDLYIIRTWDGNGLIYGPDVFHLSVVDGPLLLYTTFNNPIYPERGKCTTQAYPGEYAGDTNRPRSGAAEVDTLGFRFGTDGMLDATYELSYTFSHHGSELAIDFAAQGLEALDNESWGIANVQVSVASPGPAPVVARHSVAAPARPARVVTHVAARRTFPPKPRPAARRSVTKVKKPAASHPAHPPTRLHPKEKPPEL